MFKVLFGAKLMNKLEIYNVFCNIFIVKCYKGGISCAKIPCITIPGTSGRRFSS